MSYALSLIMTIISLILSIALAFNADIVFTEITLYICMAISIITLIIGIIFDIKEEKRMYSI